MNDKVIQLKIMMSNTYLYFHIYNLLVLSGKEGKLWHHIPRMYYLPYCMPNDYMDWCSILLLLALSNIKLLTKFWNINYQRASLFGN